MDRHEQRIVQFLSHAAHYPHPAGRIVRRETHVSHVFLAGAYAYKLKKPVRFPFLDASTLALRKRFCQLELTLNRRLAPTVYLGIVPIVEAAGRLRVGGKGKAVEWLVKMRRLPEDRMLDQWVKRCCVSRRDMRRVAARLIPFFARAARSRRISHYGLPAQVETLVLGNLSECRPFVGSLLPEADRRFIEAAYRQFLTLREPVLARRVRERRIVDGHGDLRCENICMTEPVNVFDCVEFQPAFRCGDIANDFSFLLMDLECRGRGDLAAVLEDSYRRGVSDPTFDVVAPFYKCHRSLVRGKVRGFAWLQHPRSAQGRAVRGISRRHFQRAVRYARQCSRPRLVVVGGLIGTGKSTLARSLSSALGAAWLRTDEIRLKEFARYRRARQGFAGGLYAPRVSQRVYQALITRAEALLRQGHSVVCDGMFTHASGRRLLRGIARRCGASFHFFECVVPRAVALRRVAKRYAGKTDLSEAKPEHYDRLRAGFEPVHELAARERTRLSDNRPAQATHRAALDVLRRAWT